MRRYQDLKLFFVDSGLRYPIDGEHPFALIYFSENSTLIEDFPKLHIRRQDIKYVMVPTTRIPRTILTSKEKLAYKDVGLYAITDKQKLPKGQSIIIDLSKYLSALDEKYKPVHYRQRVGFLMKAIVAKVYLNVPSNYKKIFVYSENNVNPVNKYINKKIFPFLEQIKDGSFRYDDLLYIRIREEGSRQRIVMKDKETNFNRFVTLLKKADTIKNEEEDKVKVKKVSEKIVKKIPEINKLDKNKKKDITNAISLYLKKSKKDIEEIDENSFTNDEATEIAMVAIISSMNGDIKSAENISKKITPDNKKKALNIIIKRYVDEILPKENATSTSSNVSVQIMDVPDVIENKSPEHIFSYRQKNVNINLKKDILNTFKVLETKEGGLKVESINIVDKPMKPGELYPNELSVVEVTLKGENGKKHNVKIDIPKINDQGVFTINGRTKCLINQIVQMPITFPKPYDSKFESSYGAFHIVSKKERKRDYLQIFIGSYKLPLFVVLASRFGFEDVCKLYDLEYLIEEKNITDKEYKIKIENKKYLYFTNVNTELKKQLVNSLLKVKISTLEIKKLFESPDFFNEVILKLIGRVNSVYRIQSSFDNIVDPIVKQVLMNNKQPTSLPLIMKYMAIRVVEGYVIKRNDLSNQRIRNSEIIAQLVQQQVHTAHTIYKEQLLSGNDKAKFEVSRTKALVEFVNSEIVANMEYANPIEEMSVMTRVSPVGSNIGGIPDKGAITKAGRNVSDTYYGNIDVLDTPEGGNIGIIQHLTVDAVITSTRGIFQKQEISNKIKSGSLSTSSCLIPFVACNDGNRILLGANQARQSVPLKTSEAPLIQSGYESILTKNLSDNFIKKSKCDGKIKSITKNNISVQCKDGKIEKIDLTTRHLTSGSGKNTLSHFIPNVKIGDRVKKNQIIAEGSCVNQGSIAIGKTLCMALMPYKGFNFEDGVVIGESLAKSEKLTSIHGITETVEITENDKILFIVNPGRKVEKGEPLIRKIIGDINELIGYSEEDELSEISGGQFIRKSPGGKLIDVEVYSNIPLEGDLKVLKEYGDKTRKKYKMKDDDFFRNRGEKLKNIIVKFIIEQELGIKVGDKITNRHGAKGIISLIEEDKYMPTTPWGEKIEIITNPIGIINRMNVGQLYELYAGLIAKTIGYKIVALKTKSKIIPFLKTILPLLDKTKNKLLSTSFISKLNKLSQANFNLFISQIKENKGFTLIIPPFQEPKKEDLIKALKVLGLKPGYHIKLPEYNTKTKDIVPLGYMYFEKLEHIGEDKVTVRSTGPVTGKIMQPISGGKRGGGQRMGEMDVYSLLSYNAKTVLAEMFGPMSDDVIAKNEYISNIIKNGNTPFIYSGKTASRDLLNNYMVALMLAKG